ncbi:MAG: AAA family ATPase [Methanobacteriaceae archaeon]
MIIAVSGKGGTGKTMFSSILVKILAKTGKNLLVIDADADSNMPDTLGINVDSSVGDVREQLKKDTAAGNISPGTNKWDILDYKIMESMIETQDFDLLMMGRPEGSGCYCAVNTMLRKIIENISSNYDYIVIDTEAGLEHLSRRTTQNVDCMIVISDTSSRGLLTAERIGDLAKELEISFKQLYLVINRIKENNKKNILEKAKKTHLELLGTINDDELITKYDLEGKALYNLPDDAEIVLTISEMVDKIISQY